MTFRSFFTAADGRPHAPWRILLFLLLSTLCVVVVMLTLLPALSSAERLVGIDGTAEAFGMAIALLLSHWMSLRLFDHRPWSAMALDAPAARPAVMARGWLLGLVPIALVSLLMLATGLLRLAPASPGSWMRAAIQVSVILLPAALYEELLTRGYIFATLGEWLGQPAAVGLTSLGFGLLHLGNPGATPLSIALVILAGVYLAAVLVATKSLYAAWMAHWAWNWAMAVPLHVPVSGITVPRPDYQIVDAGPDWLTGGSWGPEGGVGAAFGMAAGLGYLYWRRTRRNHDERER